MKILFYTVTINYWLYLLLVSLATTGTVHHWLMFKEWREDKKRDKELEQESAAFIIRLKEHDERFNRLIK